jgi:creatinine amidohydrolase/Fe(II)-dependent formamide hydrolase-like protein
VREHLIERMTLPEVEARLSEGVDAVLLPIGTTEQHGPHMRLDTDCFIARSLALRSAELATEQGLGVLVAPTLNVTLFYARRSTPRSCSPRAAQARDGVRLTGSGGRDRGRSRLKRELHQLRGQ